MVTAVVAVRAGSTRVKNKNIRPFAGSSLLQIKLRQLKQVAGVDEILVSSDSEEMLELAHSEGAIARRRPDEYCDEKSRTFNEMVTYVASEEARGELLLWAPCVCPLVGAQRFMQALAQYDELCKAGAAHDSVVSAKLMQEYLMNEDGPVNFSVEHHVPSQRLPRWHVVTNGFFVAKREDMARWSFVYGPKPSLLEIDKLESLDIDDMFDFQVAEQAYIAQQKEC